MRQLLFTALLVVLVSCQGEEVSDAIGKFVQAFDESQDRPYGVIVAVDSESESYKSTNFYEVVEEKVDSFLQSSNNNVMYFYPMEYDSVDIELQSYYREFYGAVFPENGGVQEVMPGVKIIAYYGATTREQKHEGPGNIRVFFSYCHLQRIRYYNSTKT